MLSSRSISWIIIISSLIPIILVDRCPFCGREFVSLGRHIWRCPARVTSQASVHSSHVPLQSPVISPPTVAPSGALVFSPPPNSDDETCVCGRRCKGRRGLKAHQRACGIFKSLLQGNQLQAAQRSLTTDGSAPPVAAVCSPPSSVNSSPSRSTDSSLLHSPFHSVSLSAKPGLHLPKTKERWAEANTYFHSIFLSRIASPIVNLDTSVQSMQDEVYNYFAHTYGVMSCNDTNVFDKEYADKSVKYLKRRLALLKKSASTSDNIKELRYVSSLIRDKLSKKCTDDQNKNHSLLLDLKTRFWSTCHKIFDGAAKHLPTFSVDTCYRYFVDTLSQLDKHKIFVAPQWMAKLPPPTVNNNPNCPTYNQVATAINRCRPGSSACPLDQLSILILKHCPILRTLLHHIITECWTQRRIPECWKIGATVLIFKKGVTDEPSNFRPITLQPVWYKVFSSVYSNMMYKFLVDNKFLDQNLQKGFWKGVDGVTEHTELLAHMLRDAKRKQRSIIISLLDLKNAFGSVHQNLIRFALHYHHLPSVFPELFSNIYNNSFMTVAIAKEWTDSIKVERGVLQGDPSSPLLFNLCFNTLMLTLDQPMYRKLGYSWGPVGSRRQRAWLQFADDAAIVASDTKGAQLLLNVFQAWCTWATLDIRHDKCSSFGMMKKENNYTQILPNLSIADAPIPQTVIGGEFRYLGHVFNFDMDNKSAKEILEKKLSSLLSVTTELKIKASIKLKILSLYIHSQVIFEIKSYDFPITWIDQTLDSLCIRHIRDWLELPVSACVKETLQLPINRGGAGLTTFHHLAEKCNLLKDMHFEQARTKT